MAVAAGGDESANGRAENVRLSDLVREQRAMLNLMEDAITARAQADRALKALRSTHARHSFLLVLSDELRSIADPLVVQNVASRVLGQYLSANRVNYADVDGRKAIIRGSYTEGVSPVPPRVDFTVYGVHLIDRYVAGEPLVVDDVQNDSRFSADAQAAFSESDTAAFISVMLVKDGKPLAALGAQSKTPRQWTPDEVEIVRETAERTWSAVERARAEAALQYSQNLLAEELADARQLQQISTLLIREESIEVIYDHILDSATQFMQAEIGSMQMLNPDTGELHLLVSKGFNPESTKFWRVVRENRGATCGIAIRSGERVIVPDVESCDFMRGTEDLKHFRLSGIRAVQSTPRITRSGTVIGVLSTHWRNVTRPTERGLRLLEVLARQAADLVERSRSEEALRESEERLRRLTESFTDIAITTTNPQGFVESWNPGANSIFGYTADEIVGKSADILFTPEDRKNRVPDQEMKTARETGRAADERWHMRKNGTRFYASGVMVPLFEGTRHLGYAKIARDLTKEKEAEAELQEAHDTLESRVEQRTQDLAKANTSLRQEILDRQRAEQQRVDLLRRIVTAQEDERSRIARDMHDQLGQQLTALRLKIASLAADASMGPRLASEINKLQELAARLDSEASFLAWELRPAALDDLGFVMATRAFVAEWSRHHEIPAEFHGDRVEDKRFDPAIETNLYRIVQEALNNVFKHASAKSVNVVVEMRHSQIVLIVEDDGVGFVPEEKRVRTESGSGLGLIGMRERAAIVGGSVEIESEPGRGTSVFVKVPISSSKGRANSNEGD